VSEHERNLTLGCVASTGLLALCITFYAFLIITFVVHIVKWVLQ
jgi:hypothetical protein